MAARYPLKLRGNADPERSFDTKPLRPGAAHLGATRELAQLPPLPAATSARPRGTRTDVRRKVLQRQRHENARPGHAGIRTADQQPRPQVDALTAAAPLS